MAKQPDADLQRQVNDAFEAFRRSLHEMLTAEATQHVDSTLERLGGERAPFRVEDARVEVVIHDLKLVAADPDDPGRSKPSAKNQRRPRRTKPQAATGARQPRTGSVREALLGLFADGSQLGTTELRERLETAGVKTSDDNLHQQLRRLVQAGELRREGRGIYRRANAA